MPTIFGGCGRNGRDLDFSAIITTVLEFLVDVWTQIKALAVSIAAKLATIWNIMMLWQWVNELKWLLLMWFRCLNLKTYQVKQNERFVFIFPSMSFIPWKNLFSFLRFLHFQPSHLFLHIFRSIGGGIFFKYVCHKTRSSDWIDPDSESFHLIYIRYSTLHNGMNFWKYLFRI